MKDLKLEIIIENQARVASASQGQTVLEVALSANVDIPHSCGGMGTCGTCRVVVLDHPEGLSEPDELEVEIALDRGFSKLERLSCQARLLKSARVKKP